jgi:hypothetical protein
MLRFAFACILALAAAAPSAQQGKKHEGRQLSQEDRQRMRDDMRDAYRGRPQGPQKAQKMRQMSPEQRQKLRRDIQDANQNLKR